MQAQAKACGYQKLLFDCNSVLAARSFAKLKSVRVLYSSQVSFSSVVRGLNSQGNPEVPDEVEDAVHAALIAETALTDNGP